MTVSVIVATDKNGCIGKNNTLPFSSKKDMLFFKKITSGKDIIMGSKTWSSLPIKPLPNRRNIIITRHNLSFFDNTQDNIRYVNSLEEALDISNDPFIIGGGQIYSQAEKYTDVIYKTVFPELEIEDGDTFFDLQLEWDIIETINEVEDDLKIHFLTLKKAP